MSTHVSQEGGDDGAELPDAVPLDLGCLTRLSWELGSRVVGDDASTLRSRWEHTNTSWTLSIYRVTDHTVVMGVRTPAGRERFFGAAQSDLQSALPDLDAAPYWQREA